MSELVYSDSAILCSIAALQKHVHQNSKDKGFWDGEANRNIPTKLMLIVSELAEAMEADRKGNPPSEKLTGRKDLTFTSNINDTLLAEEMADVVIRVMDLCEYMGIDLGRVVLEKAKYNAGRPHRHGGKKY